MQVIDYFVHIILTIIMIVGVYQFYFFTQRHPRFEAKEYHSKIDEKIPYYPWWSWIYSFIYYPVIIYVNFTVESSRHFVMIAMTFMILLLMQMTFFYFLPVKTPKSWRAINQGEKYSEKFLLFVQKFDADSNCFPSMHVSVAMLCALFVFPTLGYWVFLFPLLIALSCLFTKQHYLLDLPFGALLGWIAYQFFQFLY